MGGLDCSLKTVDTIDKIGYEPIKKSVQTRPLRNSQLYALPWAPMLCKWPFSFGTCSPSQEEARNLSSFNSITKVKIPKDKLAVRLGFNIE